MADEAINTKVVRGNELKLVIDFMKSTYQKKTDADAGSKELSDKIDQEITDRGTAIEAAKTEIQGKLDKKVETSARC